MMAIICWEPDRKIENMNQIFERTMIDSARQADDISYIPAAEIHQMEQEVKLDMKVCSVNLPG